MVHELSQIRHKNTHQMFNQILAILLVLCNEHTDLKVAVDPATHSHVVGHRQDGDAVGEGGLTTNVFLEKRNKSVTFLSRTVLCIKMK